MLAGEQHYHDLRHAFGAHSSLCQYLSRDQEKKHQCSNAGIKLVTVPYWWDGNRESLREILEEEKAGEAVS